MNYSGRIDLVKHKINDHSSDRHIQPDRQGDFRNAPVPPKLVPKRTVESKAHERHDYYRQDRVTHEDREIERADKPRSLKTCCAVVIVVCEIRSQEQERYYEGSNLTRAVSCYISSSNKRVSGD